MPCDSAYMPQREPFPLVSSGAHPFARTGRSSFKTSGLTFITVDEASDPGVSWRLRGLFRYFASGGGVPQFKIPKGFEFERLGVLGLFSEIGDMLVMAVDTDNSPKLFL
jgi:hypothetical protein